MALGGGAVSYEQGTPVPIRKSTTLSSKVDLHRTIKLKAVSKKEVAPTTREFPGGRNPHTTEVLSSKPGTIELVAVREYRRILFEIGLSLHVRP